MDEIFYEGRRYLHLKAVAYKLRMKYNTVWEWKKTVPTVKRGGRIYMCLSEALEYRKQLNAERQHQLPAVLAEWIKAGRITEQHTLRDVVRMLKAQDIEFNLNWVRVVLNRHWRRMGKIAQLVAWLKADSKRMLMNRGVLRQKAECELRFRVQPNTLQIAIRKIKDAMQEAEGRDEA